MGRGGERGTGSPGPAAAASCLPHITEQRGKLSQPVVHEKPLPPPSISFAEGGRLVQVKLPARAPEMTRGVRGQIGDFSDASGRRLQQKFNAIDQRAITVDRVGFLTLTYPFFFVTPREAKRHLHRFLQQLQREHGRIPLFWKLEPQQRGAPHFHLMIFAASPAQLSDLTRWSAHTWHAIAGHDDPRHLAWHLGELGNGNKPCLEPIRSWNGACSYTSKYLAKSSPAVRRNVEQWEHPGRWWGTRFYDHLPVRIHRQDLTQAKAKLARRLLRRWYEKQPSGRWRVTDPDNGKTFRDYLRAPQLQQLRAFGYVCTPINRRWSNSRGGMTVYAPDVLGRSILAWLSQAFEVHDDDDDPDLAPGGRGRGASKPPARQTADPWAPASG